MKVWLRTFGCRANQYDTEAIREMIVQGGHTVAGDVADADYAVFNSCAVTADAVADLRRAVRGAARQNPALQTLVMGCASASPDADALRGLPGVTDLFAGADIDGVA